MHAYQLVRDKNKGAGQITEGDLAVPLCDTLVLAWWRLPCAVHVMHRVCGVTQFGTGSLFFASPVESSSFIRLTNLTPNFYDHSLAKYMIGVTHASDRRHAGAPVKLGQRIAFPGG
jgi:hypothetical protein